MFEDRPDQGWAWMVAFAACLSNGVLNGIGRLSALIYIACYEVYGCTREESSRAFSMAAASRNLIGPIVGMLGHHFGVRKVTVTGGIIATIGASCCYLAGNIFWVTIFWGGIYGLGYGLANILPQVSINHYFNKHRATAAGIAFSGGCIGSLTLPVVFEYIMAKYGLSGSFLILGGIIMHVIPAGMLMRTPAWVKVKERKRTPAKHQEATKHKNIDGSVCIKPNGHLTENQIKWTPNETMCQLCNKVIYCSSHAEQISKSSSPIYNNDKNISGKDTPRDRKYECPNACRCVVQESHITVKDKTPVSLISDRLEELKVQPPNSLRKDSSSKDQSSNSGTWNVLTNPMFLLISITLALFFYIFVAILTIIIDFALDNGIPETRAKYILPAFSIGDIVGRLCFGWVTDKKFISRNNFLVICFTVWALLSAAFVLCTSLNALLGLIAVYGLVEGIIMVIFPVTVADYMTVEEQSVAIGSMNLFAGILLFGVPPMIGYFRDTCGSYEYIFYILAALSAASAALWSTEPLLKRIHLSRRTSIKTPTKELYRTA